MQYKKIISTAPSVNAIQEDNFPALSVQENNSLAFSVNAKENEPLQLMLCM